MTNIDVFVVIILKGFGPFRWQKTVYDNQRTDYAIYPSSSHIPELFGH